MRVIAPIPQGGEGERPWPKLSEEGQKEDRVLVRGEKSDKITPAMQGLLHAEGKRCAYPD